MHYIQPRFQVFNWHLIPMESKKIFVGRKYGTMNLLHLFLQKHPRIYVRTSIILYLITLLHSNIFRWYLLMKWLQLMKLFKKFVDIQKYLTFVHEGILIRLFPFHRTVDFFNLPSNKVGPTHILAKMLLFHLFKSMCLDQYTERVLLTEIINNKIVGF